VIALDDLRRSPNALAPQYARFGVADRLLLSGHSHQAWPDVALDGQIAAFEDAARHVDEKWARAYAKADAVRAGLRVLLDDPAAELALGTSTHELVIRFLSALDLRARPRLVTTDGEFHTLRRQLDRAAEAGLEVVRVAAEPADTLAERLAAAVDDRTAAVLASAVLFESGRVVGGLGATAEAAARHGAEALVDVYHALGPVPFSLHEQGLEQAWIVGGGYKYL
jgi:kynureninase